MFAAKTYEILGGTSESAAIKLNTRMTKERNALLTITGRKAKCIGRFLHRNCPLKHLLK
jgi:precorrin-6x reductase